MGQQRPIPGRAATHGRYPLLAGSLLLYRHLVSPVLHTIQRTLTGSTGACRFQPTCSEYAAIAVHNHGARRGGQLALMRFLRCHPFTRGGFDPVPNLNEPSPAEDAIHAHHNPAGGIATAETASHLP